MAHNADVESGVSVYGSQRRESNPGPSDYESGSYQLHHGAKGSDAMVITGNIIKLKLRHYINERKGNDTQYLHFPNGLAIWKQRQHNSETGVIIHWLWRYR